MPASELGRLLLLLPVLAAAGPLALGLLAAAPRGRPAARLRTALRSAEAAGLPTPAPLLSRPLPSALPRPVLVAARREERVPEPA